MEKFQGKNKEGVGGCACMMRAMLLKGCEETNLISSLQTVRTDIVDRSGFIIAKSNSASTIYKCMASLLVRGKK